MTVSSIQIKVCRGFGFPESMELNLNCEMTVSDLVIQCLHLVHPSHLPDPANYGIFLHPPGVFLYHKCLIGHYIPQLCQPVSLELLPRVTRPIGVIYLKNRTVIDVEPTQPVKSVIYQAYRKFAATLTLPQSKSWSFVFQSNVLSPDIPISTIFNPDESVVPVVLLRLEYPVPSVDAATPIFKGSLADAVAKSKSPGVPYFFTALLNRVAVKKELEGIYRKSGLQTNIDAIVDFIDHNTDNSAISGFLEAQAGHDVACVVKQYIRTMSPAIIPIEFSPDFKEVLTVPNVRHSLQLLKVLVTCLPTFHYQLLKEFSEHTEVIVAAENQMNISNIALVLGGNFFRAVGTPLEVVNETTLFQNLAGLIFQHWRFIFLNEPLNLTDRYVITKRDVTLPKCVVPTGHRMKFIDNVNDTEVKLEYSGLATTVAAADVEFVDDDASPPTFWKVIENPAASPRTDFFIKTLEPNEVPVVQAGPLKAALEADIDELKTIETSLKEFPSTDDSPEKTAAIRQVLRRLGQF
jgi:hypothetical protein